MLRFGVRSLVKRRFVASLLGCSTLASVSYSYGFYQLSAGRNDRSSFYDLAGTMYPNQANAVYDFGNFGSFASLPPSVTAAMANTAVASARSTWSQFSNVTWGNTTGATGTGLIRLRYDSGLATGAYCEGFGTGGNTFAQITFGQRPQAGTDWNAANFGWVMRHEVGHALGLWDWYTNPVEEFVDHPTNDPALPNKTPAAFQDNIMNQYNYAGNDYSQQPQTIADNDEVAAMVWLWGGTNNQIVTGDFANSWAAGTRAVVEHHGHQTGGTWTYRGTFVQPGMERPYVDLEFAGYQSFMGDTFGDSNPGWVYGGNQGGDIQRFYVDEAGWTGNWELNVTSRFTREKRIKSWVVGGNYDTFLLDPVLQGIAFDGVNNWAMPFGPVPEPATVACLGLGMLALLRRAKKRR
jgi:hypothetical protein